MSWLPDWLTGFDREAYEDGRRADERNRQITEDLHNRGIMTDEDYRTANEHYDAAAAYNPDADIASAFDEGWNEGASNIRGFFGGIINRALSTLKIIPWPVWVAAGLYAAWRLGLIKLPKGK